MNSEVTNSGRRSSGFARWGVAVWIRGELVTHWFWWEGASAAYADHALALHGNAELVTRTNAEAAAALAESMAPMLAEAQSNLDAVAAAAFARIGLKLGEEGK